MTGVEQFIFLHPLVQDEAPVFNKTSADSVQIEGVLKNRLSGNPYVLTGCVMSVFDSDGNDVSESMVGTVTNSFSNGKVSPVIQGGESGKKYIVYFDFTTVEHPLIRGAVRLKVKDLKP